MNEITVNGITLKQGGYVLALVDITVNGVTISGVRIVQETGRRAYVQPPQLVTTWTDNKTIIRSFPVRWEKEQHKEIQTACMAAYRQAKAVQL